MSPSELERFAILRQLLDDATTAGDVDKITELEADLFHQFPNETQLGDPELQP